MSTNTTTATNRIRSKIMFTTSSLSFSPSLSRSLSLSLSLFLSHSLSLNIVSIFTPRSTYIQTYTHTFHLYYKSRVKACCVAITPRHSPPPPHPTIPYRLEREGSRFQILSTPPTSRFMLPLLQLCPSLIH